jgi:diacylglycerol kinase family enzyme
MIVAALKPADRLRAVDLIVEATQADSVLVCADAPVQAVVAAVAASHDLPFACMPAGPDDLLARDLGAALDDPGEALSLPFSSVERTIDLAEVNGVQFVNYAAVGVALPATVSHPRRADRRKPLPGPGRTTRAAPAAVTHPGGEPMPAVLVCNNRFELGEDHLGTREWPDSGLLQVVAFADPGADRTYAAVRHAGFQEHSERSFELPGRSTVRVDIDGEPRDLRPPLRFRCLHSALRVRTTAANAGAPEGTAQAPAELESLRTG